MGHISGRRQTAGRNREESEDCISTTPLCTVVAFVPRLLALQKHHQKVSPCECPFCKSSHRFVQTSIRPNRRRQHFFCKNPLRAWHPRTNGNAPALKCKHTVTTTGVVDKQLPKFCRFFNAASTRGRNTLAREPAGTGTTKLRLSLRRQTSCLGMRRKPRNMASACLPIGPTTRVVAPLVCGQFSSSPTCRGTRGATSTFCHHDEPLGKMGNVKKNSRPFDALPLPVRAQSGWMSSLTKNKLNFHVKL